MSPARPCSSRASVGKNIDVRWRRAAATHEIGNPTVDGPASVIAQNAERGCTVIAVSDPTFARETVSVMLRGRRDLLDQSDPDVTAHFERGVTRLDIPTHHAYGTTITVTVQGRGIV